MHDQSDDLEIDVQSLFIDESDVDESVELEERLPQLCALGEDEIVFKILVGCPVTSDILLKIMMLNYFCSRSRTNILLQFLFLLFFHYRENVQTTTR